MWHYFVNISRFILNFSTRLEVASHHPKTTRQFLSIFLAHFPAWLLIRLTLDTQITLIADKDEGQWLSTCISSRVVLLDARDIVFHIGEWIVVGQIKDYYHTISVAEKLVCQRAEPFLASRVPELDPAWRPICTSVLADVEIDPTSRSLAGSELPITVALDYGCLADSAISDQQHI